MRTLVLNAGYEPLAVVSFKRALVLVMGGKAVVVENDDGLAAHDEHERSFERHDSERLVSGVEYQGAQWSSSRRSPARLAGCSNPGCFTKWEVQTEKGAVANDSAYRARA